MDLYDLLQILKDKIICIIELGDKTQQLFDGATNNFNCIKAKYEVIKFEKRYIDNSYVITIVKK